MTPIRGFRPEDLWVLARLTTVGGVVRDEQYRAVAPTPVYRSMADPGEDLLAGSTLSDLMHPPAAEEREAVLEQVARTNEPMRYIQAMDDQRMIVTVLPLDVDAFGHAGTVSIGELPSVNRRRIEPGAEAKRMLHPVFDELSRVSPRELDVLYLVALGFGTEAIGEQLFRSGKTIATHIGALHRKVGTSTRAELVAWATNRGLDGFAPDHWQHIAQNAALAHAYPEPRLKRAIREIREQQRAEVERA